MPKTSIEKQLEKSRAEMKRQAEIARKDEKALLRKEQELAKKEEVRQRATAIISRQEIVDGFQILDNDAEIVLNCLVEHCANTQSGHVNFENSFFPSQYRRTISFELEKLVQYGMLTVVLIWGNGGVVNLFPSAFSYKTNKERAMLAKATNKQTNVGNNFYGNTNVISGDVNSSTILAGDSNSIITNQRESVYPELKNENEADSLINNSNKIFISHRSSDKDITEMLLDFFVDTGIPRDAVFCSSLPGNDVEEKISSEIKDALHSSVVNIVLLSKDYFDSTYCLNEAGVIWFVDVPVIPIALPEITHENMKGFINNEYKIRRLDNENDIAYIYDTIVNELHLVPVKTVVYIEKAKQLKRKYEEYLARK